MQLAILLSLIHRRGASLPDKRTALYDSYVDMFFDRESEKATVVKENRDLLIRIHRFLAWVLQSGAEVTSESPTMAGSFGTSLSGTISEVDLKALLREFLERDGSNVALVEELFGGMVERVVAIVSRVQGSYEFDVQTLREYFAARHLYQTAPYSPAGAERQGTISDRWLALARNYYWFNVARFYAGCYSEGELSSLVDDLRALGNDKVFRCTSHPQMLASTLLGDWVFSQRPRAAQDAVDLLLEPRGLRLLMAGAGSGWRRVEDVIVRDPAGNDRLIAGCKELIRRNQPIEQVMDIVRGVLLPNSDPKDLFDWWIEELRSSSKAQASQWCVIGELLQCWSKVDLVTVRDLLGREKVPAARVIAGLLHANRMDVLESDEDLFEAAVERVLAGDGVGWFQDDSLLQRLAWSVQRPLLVGLGPLHAFSGGISLLEYLRRFRGYEGRVDDITWPNYPAAERCVQVVQAFTRAAERPVEEWNASIEPWDLVVQQGISEFGERGVFVDLANLAAGIRSREEKCQDSPNLFDSHRPIVRRARYARLQAGSPQWWSKQLQSATNTDNVQMALLLFTTWAGARTIEHLAEEVDKLVVSLGTTEWHRLHSSLRMAGEVNSARSWIRPVPIRVSALPSGLSIQTVALLAERCRPATKDQLYERYMTDYKGDDSIILTLRTEVQVGRALRDETKWSQAIEGLRLSHSARAPIGRALFLHLRQGFTLPDAIAREVVVQPLEFPADLVWFAEAHCRQVDAANILPVGRVATDDAWFSD